MRCRHVPIILLVLAIPALCPAASHVVDSGGGGDFDTLGAAIAAAVAGDRIKVMPGVYAESCTLTVGLEVKGLGGASATILDGGGTRLILWIRGAGGCTISGFTFTGGYHDSGAAIHISDQADVTVRDCIFEDNYSTWDGGAIYTCMSGTTLDVSDCLFIANDAVHNGGAMGVNTSSQVDISNCEFRNNTSQRACGAVGNHDGAHLNVTECLFVGNTGNDAGALRTEFATSEIRQCTIHENPSTTGYSVQLLASGTVFERNIVTNESSTPCFNTAGGSHDYNIFNGRGGAGIGEPLADHEWYMDPGYCDYENGDLTLCSTSLGLPENNGSGLIGLYGMGCSYCGPVRTRESSWGAVKALFR